MVRLVGCIRMFTDKTRASTGRMTVSASKKYVFGDELLKERFGTVLVYGFLLRNKISRA
jgi:hypothetical protein